MARVIHSETPQPSPTDSTCVLSLPDTAGSINPEIFRTIVDTLGEAGILLDPAGNIAYVNDHWCSLLGVGRRHSLGRPLLHFLTPDSHRLFTLQWRHLQEGGKRRFELSLTRTDGGELEAVLAPAPIFDDAGAFSGCFIVITDIGARKHIERQLEEEHRLLATLMDHLPDAVYIKDKELHFSAANRSLLQFLGKQRIDAVLGKTDRDFFPAPLARQYEALDREVLASGQPALNILEQSCSADGETRWLLVSRTPLRDRNGAIVGLIGVNRDITDRERFEEALAESEERFRLIMEYSRDIAYKINCKNGCFEYLSPSLETLTGWTPDAALQLHRMDILKYIHPEDQAHYLDHDRRVAESLRQGTPPPLCEFRIRHKDGQYRWFSDSAMHIHDADGDRIAIVGNLRDITESRRTEEALRAASRMETAATLAGGIAHDFNNLMSTVLTNAELLEMLGHWDDETLSLLRAMAQAAEHGGELAQQMLAFARGGKYQPEILQLNDVIRRMITLDKSALPGRVRLDTRLSETAPTINADPTQMAQVITNLLLNAIEAVGDRGHITLSTGSINASAEFALQHPGLQPGPHTWFAIEDDGPGMTPDIAARVFEPFFSTKFPGRGLGLAAVYGIVKNHQGHIRMDTEPGRGARFTLYFPEASPESLDDSYPGQLELPMGSETILVVDDEDTVLHATRMMLERLGYTVLLARNGKEAVRVVHRSRDAIHLVLLDLAMPELDGPEAFAQIHSLRPTLPVIICSGYERNDKVQQVLDAGARLFLQKPYRTQLLANALRQILADSVNA